MTAEVDNRNDVVNRFVSSGVLFTIGLAAAYLLVYSYESGYAYAFGIPRDLIEITLGRLLFIGTASTIVIFMLAAFASDMWHFRKTARDALEFCVRRDSAELFFGVFVVAYFFSGYWKAWAYLAVFVLVTTSMVYVPPLISQRRKKISYGEKFLAHNEGKTKRYEASLTRELDVRLGRGIVKYFWTFLLTLSIAWLAGNFHASDQKDFFLLEGDPEHVVLRMYGDTVVAAPFDRVTKTVEKRFIVYSTQNIPLRIHSAKLGPLSVKE